MSTSASERRKRKTEARKEEILRSAARAFARKGYHGTSMEEIADALHMTKGSLYYYFKDKEEILFACHDHSLNLVLENLERVESLDVPAEAKLRELIIGHVEVMLEALQGSALAMEFTALGDALLRDIVEKRDRFEAGLRRFIQQGIDAGSFAPIDIKLATFTVLGAINWLPKWYRAGGSYDARTIGKFFADHFIAGLKGGEGGALASPSVEQASSLRSPDGAAFQPTNLSSSAPADAKSITRDLEIRRRNLPHMQADGATYHVIWRTEGRELSPEARSLVLEAIRFQHPERMHVHIAVVMPDHVHLLVQPVEKADGGFYDLSTLLHSVKSFSANQVNRLMGWQGKLWQAESFDRVVRGEHDYAEKWDYVRDNPGKAGLAPELEKWDAWFVGSDRSGRAHPLGKEQYPGSVGA